MAVGDARAGWRLIFSRALGANKLAHYLVEHESCSALSSAVCRPAFVVNPTLSKLPGSARHCRVCERVLAAAARRWAL